MLHKVLRSVTNHDTSSSINLNILNWQKQNLQEDRPEESYKPVKEYKIQVQWYKKKIWFTMYKYKLKSNT